MVKRYILSGILCLLIGNSIAQNKVVTDSIYELPFTETFTTGAFETNQWIAESSNWVVTETGDPAPGVIFSKNPSVTDYSSSLTSPWLNAGNFTDGRIYLDFDMKNMTDDQSDTEFLYIDVFDGNEWIQKIRYFITYAAPDWVHQSIDLTDEALHKQFKVRFRAEGDTSVNLEYWAIDNIEIYRKCMPPINLEYTHSPLNPCLITLNWDAPGNTGPGSDAWLSWDNGENYSGIGSMCGNCKTTVAIRFTPLQLYPYNNFKLTAIRYFPNDEDGTITLKVWTGANASQLVLTQPVDSFVAGQWNEVTLDNPLTITNTDELWIGYDADVIMGSPVPGIDYGPSVSGYGDMIGFNGSSLESLSLAYGLQGNWNLKGFVTDDVNQSVLKSSQSFIEYHIYRNSEYIGSTNELTYTDNFSGISWPVYNVTATYTDCESEFSNPVSLNGTLDSCNVSVEDIPFNNVKIYPNPCTDHVIVDCYGDLRDFTLIDIMGRVIGKYHLTPGNTTLKINLARFHAGIYTLKFENVDGKTGTKKLVKL